MYSLFIFSFLYVFQLYNLIYIYIYITHFYIWWYLVSYFEYIILGINSSYIVWHCFLSFSFFFFFFSFKLLFSLTHTLTSIKWGPLNFHKIQELPLHSFSMKIKMLNMCFQSLYSNLTFRILKMKNEYKCLNQTSFFFFFFWWPPLKTENENKRHNFFQLTKHALSFFYKF